MGVERQLSVFARVDDCLLQQAVIQEKLVTSQGDEFRANGLDQPPTRSLLEQTNDADDRQIQSECQPSRRAVVEDVVLFSSRLLVHRRRPSTRPAAPTRRPRSPRRTSQR